MYGIDVEWMCEREKTVKRAVFAWNGVETEDRVILDKYQIDIIFMDINHYSSISNYNIFVLAGDPSWRADDMQKVVDEAKGKRADGIIFDIENDHSLLASSLPIYVCIPF